MSNATAGPLGSRVKAPPPGGGGATLRLARPHSTSHAPQLYLVLVRNLCRVLAATGCMGTGLDRFSAAPAAARGAGRPGPRAGGEAAGGVDGEEIRPQRTHRTRPISLSEQVSAWWQVRRRLLRCYLSEGTRTKPQCGSQRRTPGMRWNGKAFKTHVSLRCS